MDSHLDNKTLVWLWREYAAVTTFKNIRNRMPTRSSVCIDLSRSKLPSKVSKICQIFPHRTLYYESREMKWYASVTQNLHALRSLSFSKVWAILMMKKTEPIAPARPSPFGLRSIKVLVYWRKNGSSNYLLSTANVSFLCISYKTRDSVADLYDSYTFGSVRLVFRKLIVTNMKKQKRLWDDHMLSIRLLQNFKKRSKCSLLSFKNQNVHICSCVTPW